MNIRSLSEIETLLKFRADCNKVFNEFGNNTNVWKTKKPIVLRYITKLLMADLLYGTEEVESIIRDDYLTAAMDGELMVTDELSLLETDVYYAVLLYRYIWLVVTEPTVRISIEQASKYKEQLAKYYGIIEKKSNTTK